MRSGVRDSEVVMSAKVNSEAPSTEPDHSHLTPPPGPPPPVGPSSSAETILFCGTDAVPKSKPRVQPHTTTALLLPAPVPSHQKVEVTQAVTLGDGTKATPLTAHVGGACSIVHVLEWKEGMAILPSTNLKFCVTDVGALSTIITPGSTGSTPEPAAAAAARPSGKSTDSDKAPAEKKDLSPPIVTVRPPVVEPEGPVQKRPVVQTKAEMQSKTEVHSKIEVQTKTEAQSKTEVLAKTELPTKIEVLTKSEVQTKTEVPIKADAQSKTAVQAKTEPPTKTEIQMKAEAQTKVQVQTKAEVPTKTEVQTKPGVQIKAEVPTGASLHNHVPKSTPRSFGDELRREPITDKRTIVVEKVPAGGRVSLNADHLKPMRKRKRKEYLSPSDEDSDLEGTDEKMDDSKSDCRLIRGGGDNKTELWTWAQYLEDTKSIAAPTKLFRESQRVPTVKNGFKQGMKLEGIDPQHPSMYFVLTVAEVCGYRLRLHFDGYSDCHDFWVNANSSDIHATGWCEATEHKLHTPKGCKEEEFTWTNYLKMTKAQVAPKELFASPGRTDVNCGFEVGMKLEAVDRMNPSLICVATVTDVVDQRFLVHFDNWDDTYDYWCDSSSPYIHPIGWCQERNLPLTPPQDYPDQSLFSWSRYLEETGARAVAPEAFKMRPPHSFQTHMKLEAVDRRSPGLIRVATVEEVDTHRIKIHYDGWSHVYDEWMDSDNPDIHPAGWCEATGHPLKVPPRDAKAPQTHGVREPPVTGQSTYPSSVPCKPMGHTRTSKYSFHNRKCPTPGCDGSGHVTGRFTAHHCISGCPLAERNQGRLKADLSDSEGKRNLFFGQRTKKTHYRGRIGRPPKYRKNQQRDYQGLSAEDVYPSLFMSALSGQSDRSLSLCWEQHCKLLPGVQGIDASQVAAWSVDEVFMFVQNLIGCEEQARLFKEEMIDGEAFLLLTQTDIVKIMSIKLGPALKISNAILMLKSTDDGLK